MNEKFLTWLRESTLEFLMDNPLSVIENFKELNKPPKKSPKIQVSKTTTLNGRERTRELVRIRDKHQCQTCGKFWYQGLRRFDIHHLNGLCGKRSRGYDKVSDMPGLITLCHKCHFNHPEHSFKIQSIK